MAGSERREGKPALCCVSSATDMFHASPAMFCRLLSRQHPEKCAVHGLPCVMCRSPYRSTSSRYPLFGVSYEWFSAVTPKIQSSVTEKSVTSTLMYAKPPSPKSKRGEAEPPIDTTSPA
eukprot:422517-Rhodomonas_salina.1